MDRGIIWVEIFTNKPIILMTSLAFRFNDIVIMFMLNSVGFFRVFAECLKNGLTDFYKTYVIFRQSIVSFKI